MQLMIKFHWDHKISLAGSHMDIGLGFSVEIAAAAGKQIEIRGDFFSGFNCGLIKGRVSGFKADQTGFNGCRKEIPDGGFIGVLQRMRQYRNRIDLP